ncbi:MAG: hypothetical protein LHV69_05300 [Elusimicrobia bacterium]|nr:hypothetical protein [Candidatus Obscuribacterium magneticum]
MKAHFRFDIITMAGVFLFTVPSSFADELDSLIKEEQKEESAWAEEPAELPEITLFGDAQGVEVISPMTVQGVSVGLCEPMEYDEIVEMSRGDKDEKETVLNWHLPRVREVLERSCLVRPGDTLLAVGKGWQKLAVIRDFAVRKEGQRCQDKAPYALWLNIKERLPEEPIFFTAPPDLKEGANMFKSVDDLPRGTLGREHKKLLEEEEVTFLDDYKITVYAVDQPNCQELIELKRQNVGPEDDGLPNALLYGKKGEHMELILSEPVDIKKGSGHIELEGLLDFNGDGRVDLWMRGDREGCVYQKLFRGEEEGFTPLSTPEKRCRCDSPNP